MMEMPEKRGVNIEGIKAMFMSKEEKCELDKQATLYEEEMMREKALSEQIQKKAVGENTDKFMRYKYESKL